MPMHTPIPNSTPGKKPEPERSAMEILKEKWALWGLIGAVVGLLLASPRQRISNSIMFGAVGAGAGWAVEKGLLGGVTREVAAPERPLVPRGPGAAGAGARV